MKREIDLYIKDILDNMENAEKFIGDMTFEEFSADRKTAYAVLRCIENWRGIEKRTSRYQKTVSSHTLEENGRNARQSNSLLFWCELQKGMVSG